MSFDEKEMLALAAKAAGISFGWGIGETPCIVIDGAAQIWDPITFTETNRDLQVQLRLGLVPQEEGGWVCLKYNSDGDEVRLSADKNPNLAVVRAAAEIGRRMP